ncbi:MAG: hypothetical protein ABJB22_00255 [Verrucomicrobiota bacterium]
MTKRALTAFILVLSAASHLHAVSYWTETASQIDEIVANAKTVPPPGMLQPLLANVPFSNFRYPHVDAHENVTFIADDPVYSDKVAHHGIYRSMGGTGELRPLVRKDETAVPNTSMRFDWFRGLQVDGADFVFNATDSGGDRGLYHWSDNKIQLIARTGFTSLPEVGRALTEVEYGALADGRVLYNAKAGKENLLVLHDLKTQRARVLCRSGMPVPGRKDEQLRYFSPQDWLDHSNIVFRAATVDDPHAKGKSALGQRGIYGWLGIDWKKPDESLNPGRLVTLADRFSRVPLQPEKSQFNDFRSAPVRAGLVAFVGSDRGFYNGNREAGFDGVYYYDLNAADKFVRPVVDTESRLEGLFSGSFTRFGIFGSVFEKSVVFVGYAKGGYVGVFLFRTDRDELFLLCDNRNLIENKQVQDFEIAGDFLVRNRFAVTAHFRDETSGVYLATIPMRCFKRMADAK